MRIVSFYQEAFEQYSNWAKTDKKLFERLHRLIIETAKNPFAELANLNRLKLI